MCRKFEAYPNFRYVHEPALGLSQARNTGFREARTNYVGYIDDDATAGPRWIEGALRSFLDLSPCPQWVGGPIDLNWSVPDPGWISADMEVALGKIDLGSEARFLVDGERLGGGNSFYPKSVLEEAGGFDIRLGRKGTNLLSAEETQLQHRIQSQGGQLYYHPDVLIHHLVAAERVVPKWFYRRYYWGGFSNAVMDRTLDRLSHSKLELEPAKNSLARRVMRNSWSASGLAGKKRAICGRLYFAYIAGWIRGRCSQ